MTKEIKRNTDDFPESQHHIALAFLRALAWPVFALLVLLSFWKPLHRIFNLIPDMVSKSETITVGSVAIRVGKPLSARATEEIRKELSGLNPEDVVLILQSDLGTGTYVRGSDDLLRWARIARQGLVVQLTTEELAKYQKEQNEKEPYDYGIRTTGEYDRLRQFLINVVTEVAVQTSSAAEESGGKKP